MSDRPGPPRLRTTLLRAGLPAYLLPAASASFGAVQTGDEHLGVAALTTISGTSLLVSLAAALVVHRRGTARMAASGPAFALRCAGVALLVAGFACAVLVGNGLAPSSLLTEVLPSAALGAAITAAAGGRAARRRLRPRRTASRSAPAPAG